MYINWTMPYFPIVQRRYCGIQQIFILDLLILRTHSYDFIPSAHVHNENLTLIGDPHVEADVSPVRQCLNETECRLNKDIGDIFVGAKNIWSYVGHVCPIHCQSASEY